MKCSKTDARLYKCIHFTIFVKIDWLDFIETWLLYVIFDKHVIMINLPGYQMPLASCT